MITVRSFINKIKIYKRNQRNAYLKSHWQIPFIHVNYYHKCVMVTFLINEPRDISVCPAGLVQVVWLLQHLGQSLASDERVTLTPSVEFNENVNKC